MSTEEQIFVTLQNSKEGPASSVSHCYLLQAVSLVIYACHSDKLGGHLGRDKIREKITTRFAINQL